MKIYTAQKMKFSTEDFFSKCGQTTIKDLFAKIINGFYPLTIFAISTLIFKRVLNTPLIMKIVFSDLGNSCTNYRYCTTNTTAQLHSSKPELRYSAGSNPASAVSEICDGEDLGQWPRLEIRLNVFRR